MRNRRSLAVIGLSPAIAVCGGAETQAGNP